MFSTTYPDHTERQVHALRAHRMRGAVVAGLFRDLARLFSAAAR